MGAKHGTPESRFWRYVAPNHADECWPWAGGLNSKGYGRLAINGAARLAHRFSYELAKGAVPPGHEVCHSCDNPSCVNPEHLFAATHYENMQDMTRKGRASDTKGEKCGKAKLSNADVCEILRRFSIGDTGTQIAEDFGVSHTTTYAIKNSKRWAHILRDARNLPVVSVLSEKETV